MNYIQMLILNIKKNINFKHVSINEFYYYCTVLILGTLNIHAIFQYLSVSLKDNFTWMRFKQELKWTLLLKTRFLIILNSAVTTKY